MADGHPPDNPAVRLDVTVPELLELFHELRHDKGVLYAGADPMLRAWLALALTVDRRLREVVEQQARIADALERLEDADLGEVLRSLSGDAS